MTLIKCPECEKEVSDKAKECPKCAYPIKQKKDKKEVQTIQQTKKEYKKQMLLAVPVIIIGGVILLTSSVSDASTGKILGVIITLSGIIWCFVIKTQIWWHHK